MNYAQGALVNSLDIKLRKYFILIYYVRIWFVILQPCSRDTAHSTFNCSLQNTKVRLRLKSAFSLEEILNLETIYEMTKQQKCYE